MTYTIIIILLTAATSYQAFNNGTLYYNLILWPKKMHEPKEYYRLLTSGFIHADWNHLIFNMLTLYFFGSAVEGAFTGRFTYLALYLSGIVVAALPSYAQNKNNDHYTSLGASGGVSAVLFSSIYFHPWATINFFIPAVLYGVFYIGYCIYMDKRGRDNINHNAHLWGGIYGFLFTLIEDPSHGQNFLFQIMHPAIG